MSLLSRFNKIFFRQTLKKALSLSLSSLTPRFCSSASPIDGSFTAQLNCRLNQGDRLVVLFRQAVELV